MLFGKLLPREGNFFEMFNQHADRIVEAAHAFSNLVANYNGYGLRLGEESELLRSESTLLLHLNLEILHRSWENIQQNLEEVTGSF